MINNISLWVAGVLLILSVAVRFFIPTWGLSKALVSRLNSRKTTKGFLICHNINGGLLGAILIVSGFLPDYLKLRVCLPLLAIVFISVLVSNKICIGTFWAYVPNR